MKFWLSFCLCALAGVLPASTVVTPLVRKGKVNKVSEAELTAEKQKALRAQWQLFWSTCLRESIADIQRHGAGGYSVKDDAHEALARCFRWDDRTAFPQFSALAARPSFCSGAVYVALVSALMRWEAKQIAAAPQSYKRQFSPSAWVSLLPLRYKDGERAWGWANSNGPGFAALIHHLGAGFSFTDWAKARPYDVVKLWWTNELGGKERGHLAIVLAVSASEIRFWSSNLPDGSLKGGYGIRSVPRSKVQRVLFTRITQPAAFNQGASVPNSPWLLGLLTQPTTWAECLRAAGVSKGQ